MREKTYRKYDESGKALPGRFWKKGWHYCGDFDDLLVGPGMMEMSVCNCPARPPEIAQRAPRRRFPC